MNIDIQQMQTFITVVREQNFRRAAKLLNISQPTVTLRIKALEQEVGSVLINRHDNNLTLTSSGEVVLTYIEKMLYVLQDVKDHLSSIPTPQNRYSIAAIPSFCTYALPTLLKEKYMDNKLQFTIQNVSSLKVMQLVVDGAVDFGILRGPINKSSAINSKLLYKEKIYLAVPKDHKLETKEKVQIRDLLAENVITFKRRFWSFFTNRVLELGGSFQEKIMVDGEITAKKFVSQGLGVTILPEFSIKKSDLDHITLREIEDFTIERSAYLVFREEQDKEIIDQFFQWVKASLGTEEGSAVYSG